MRLRDAIERARRAGVDRLDAQLLLGQVLQRPRGWLIAHDDEALDAASLGAFEALVARRAGGEPLAYLTGEREFHGLALRVTPAVLVPRPETEGLVDWALELLRDVPGPRVADLGCGSGAIALAIRHARPDASVVASDDSDAALDVARANGERLGLAVDWRLGSWWAPHAGRRYRVVVANPPYVAAADRHLDALRHEPRAALTPGGDGLAALRALIEGAPDHLEPGGWLLLEHGHDQAGAVRDALAARGFAAVATRQDLAGLPRCTGGCWGASGASP